ncbi:MAG: AAA domain-containing protein [Thaumarchaeota archaeon]|nr:AAA domain-containing protein [Nitrososphaerota archaeon]
MDSPDSPGGASGQPPKDAWRMSLEGHYERCLNRLIKKSKNAASICLVSIAKASMLDIYTCEELGKGTMAMVTKQCASASPGEVVMLPDSLERELGDPAPVGSQPDASRGKMHKKYLGTRSHLKVLGRNLQQEEEETGEQIGHVGFPFVEGQSYGRAIRGPIALFAASLERKRIKGGHGWVLDVKAQDPMLNMALIKALEKAGDIRLDDMSAKFNELVDKMRQDGHKTPDALFDMVSSWAEGMLGIEATSRTAKAGPLLPLGDDYEPGSWPLHMANRMAFGKFPQADVDLAGDYRRLGEIQDDGGLIGDVLGITRGDDASGAMRRQPWHADPGEEPYDRNTDKIDAISARGLNAVCPSDTSQDMAILESKRSPVTVIKGPPGTGKSQLIVNMAANAMQAGKKVLVVCQKHAALEVVHSRLADAGLAECVVLMSKESNDRRAVYRQMAEALDRASNDTGKSATMHRNDALNGAIMDIDATTAELARISDALYEPHCSGANAHELRSVARAGYTGKGIPAIDALELTWEELGPFAKRVGELQKGCLMYDDTAHPLCGIKSLHSAAYHDAATLRRILERLAEISGGALGKALRARHACGATAHDIYGLARAGYTGKGIPAIDALELTWEELGPFAKRVGELQGGCLMYDNEEHPFRGRRSLAGAPAGARSRLQDVLSRLVDISGSATVCPSPGKQKEASKIMDTWAKKSPRWLHRRSASKRLQALVGRQVDESSMGAERQRITAGIEWWEKVTALGEFFTEDTMVALKGLALQDGTARVGRCGKAVWKSMLGALGEYEKILSHDARKRDSPARLLDVLESLRKHKVQGDWGDAVTQEVCLKWAGSLGERFPELEGDGTGTGGAVEWHATLRSLHGFFDAAAVERLKNHATLPDSGHVHWEAMLVAMADFAQIRELGMLKSEPPSAALEVVDSLRRKMGVGGDWEDIVMQEVCLRWIGELDDQADMLKGDPLPRYNALRARLAEALEQRQAHVRDAIVSLSQESIRLRPMGSRSPTIAEAKWGEFAMEVKSEKGRSIRIAFEQHADNFLSIAPCWLMSPEAACRVFPLKKGMFDLVIVDEASQLTVEAALPVLYRGRRAVIAGDDKQLTPHDFFQAKHEDDDNGATDSLGEESLFGKASAMRQPLLLSWHYRSRHQELIDFSNHAFYAGRLNVAPNAAIRPKNPPIRWVACDGKWTNRGNAVEANKSVDLVHNTWKNTHQNKLPSIAIVTFNAVQRDAVQDEIQNRYENDEEFRQLSDRASSGESSEKLIVRNIENIQGDERDIVIFSVGYARDTNGIFRFAGGPLFTKGGENRLNVAITRARESMIVVCSIDPTDIRGTYANPGPPLFRQFLEYAKATSDQNTVAQKRVLNDLYGTMRTASRPRAQMPKSGIEESVAGELKRQGYEVHARVGKSEYRVDLAIVDQHDPSRYVLGIECDGEQFRRARSVKERDVLRPAFLEEHGWAIERVWSPSWHRSRTREVARIRSRIEEIYKSRGLPSPRAGERAREVHP